MIEYIYFVKCPNCEDEHFSFFNEAKEFALSCLSQKPIITQIEVNRNDFGECVDSCDLGTVWSWEDMMQDTTTDDEPAVFVFTKDDLRTLDQDPEFDALDNSVDFEVEIERKPIPKGMTIEQLVEEMEENEDTIECAGCEELFPKDECFYDEERGWLCGDCEDRIVKCTWCDRLYDKGDCRYEVDLGWLCDRCESAIKSRGETLTFREGNYWDFLDESAPALTEAAYRNIINLPDAKTQIIELAKLDAGALRYINNDNTINPARAKLSNNGEIGYVTDFIVNERGELIIQLDRGNGRSNELELDVLVQGNFFPSGLKRDCPAYALLTALRNAARELNRRIGVAGRRNLNANATVRNNPEAARELRDHIVKIRYEIPCGDYSESDFSEDEEYAERAVANLEKIKSKFFDDWRFGYAADAAGLVVDRSAFDADGNLKDTVYFIATEWHAVGKITFDCPVSQLSDAAKDIIKAAKVSGDFDKIKNKKEIDCIRLAYALTNYFNDVTFYEKRDTETEAVVTESFNNPDQIEFEYEDLEVTLQGAKRDVDDWDEEDVRVDYTYRVDKNDVATDLWDNFLTEEDVADVPGGFDTLEDNTAWENFLETHFDELVEKYYTQLLDFYRADAIEEYEAKYSLEDYRDDVAWDHANSRVDDLLATRFSEACSNTKSMLEELEDSDAYSERLAPCPECGEENAFDHETGICIRCGFNI